MVFRVIVLLANMSSSLPKQVGSFNLDFHVASAQVTLGPPQAAPNPLFAGAPLDFSPNGQTLRAAKDVYPGSLPLADGKALVRVPFSIAAGFTGIFALSFGAINELGDSTAMAVPLVLTDVGSISVYSKGDFDRDFDVDGVDMLVWQRKFGSPADPAGSGADGNANGAVEGGDLTIWSSRFGAGLAAARSTLVSVPEPSAFAGLVWAAILVTRARAAAASRRQRREPSLPTARLGSL